MRIIFKYWLGSLRGISLPLACLLYLYVVAFPHKLRTEDEFEYPFLLSNLYLLIQLQPIGALLDIFVLFSVCIIRLLIKVTIDHKYTQTSIENYIID